MYYNVTHTYIHTYIHTYVHTYIHLYLTLPSSVLPCCCFFPDTQAESWITEKLQTASDESYKDPANLKSKLQKHQAFEAELTAHEESIDAVRGTGEELIISGHFGGSDVENRVEALYIHWEELLEASANKGRKLEEARDHQKFNQEVDIADSCISDKVWYYIDSTQCSESLEMKKGCDRIRKSAF